MLYFIKFILAFCSIAYELVLAQSLAAFMDNTVLRYSITIGLYMCFMGFGSLAAGRFNKKGPCFSLLRVEFLLTVLGGFCLVWLYLLDMLSMPRFVFAVLAHVLIIVIGFLTGFETPLIMDMMNAEKEGKENVVLTFDYLGALTGTLIFAWVFYPVIGLMPSSIMIGVLNALAGVLLLVSRNRTIGELGSGGKRIFYFQTVLLVFMVMILIYTPRINEFFMQQYLR